MRKYVSTPKGRAAVYNAVYKSTKKLWHKQRSRVYLNWAIKTGKIIRPKNCSECKNRVKVECHHEDYKNPLVCIWLCRTCHADVERKKSKNSNENEN